MKVGDKLVCKKDIYIYHIGDIVTINGIGSSIAIGDKTKQRYLYHIDYNVYLSLKGEIWYIWNYFYTVQELRKLKLEKLRHESSMY